MATTKPHKFAAALGRKGGQSKSPAKIAASRRNGLKGGTTKPTDPTKEEAK